MGERTRCTKCKKRDARLGRRWCTHCTKISARAQGKRRREALAEDPTLCPLCCKRPRAGNSSTCAECREQVRGYAARRRAALDEAGLCAACGEEPRAEGRTTCEGCTEDQRRRSAEAVPRRRLRRFYLRCGPAALALADLVLGAVRARDDARVLVATWFEHAARERAALAVELRGRAP